MPHYEYTVEEGQTLDLGWGYWNGEQIQFTYNIATSSGTAGPDDFQSFAISGSRFGGHVAVPVETFYDAIYEGDEIFFVNLNGDHGSDDWTIHITDND